MVMGESASEAQSVELSSPTKYRCPSAVVGVVVGAEVVGVVEGATDGALDGALGRGR